MGQGAHPLVPDCRDGKHQAGHRPAVDPPGVVLALLPPLALRELPLPDELALETHQPGGLVQLEENGVAGVGGEVQLLHHRLRCHKVPLILEVYPLSSSPTQGSSISMKLSGAMFM